jgi:DNA-binding GntR family transcriptional regulator
MMMGVQPDNGQRQAMDQQNAPLRQQGEPDTLAQTALEQIVALIRSGALRPGAVINETNLARQFGMSRGPVREAVKRLEGRKLVLREAFQKARIVPLELKQIKEIFELRECLEGMACRLATLRMSDEALKELVQEVGRSQSSEAPSFQFTSEYRFDFHVAVVAGCGNARIQSVLNSEVYDLVRLYRWSRNAVPGRHGEARREHWQIARAMAIRDEDLAESLIRSHVQRSMQVLSSYPSGHPDQVS